MNVLPHPKFVDIDPAKIENDLITRYESITGKTLYPAQLERLLINIIAYAQARTLAAIQHTGEQMLVRTSSFPVIDYLGDLVGTQRLLAQPAKCTLEFKCDVFVIKQAIPAGTKVWNENESIAFITDSDIVIDENTLQAQTTATCAVVGIAGNGWSIGSFNRCDTLPINVSVSNVNVTTGGVDEESTPAYAERILIAPESYSTAGPGEAYKFFVRSVHQSIIDVAVLGPEDGLEDGHVELYPLTNDNVLTDELIQLIDAQVNSSKRRPLTDFVTVKRPVQVNYTINAELTLLRGTDSESILAMVNDAAKKYDQQHRSKLGLDLVPSQLISTLMLPGVYDVTLVDFNYRTLKKHELAVCFDIKITIVGVSDE